jgi:hypothetical protein
MQSLWKDVEAEKWLFLIDRVQLALSLCAACLSEIFSACDGYQ